MVARSEREVRIFESVFVLLEYQKPVHHRCEGGCPHHGTSHWIHGQIGISWRGSLVTGREGHEA